MASLLKLNPNYTKFEHIEVSPDAARYMEAIAKRLNEYNGSALVIDYGHDGQGGDTFRVPSPLKPW